MQPNATKFKLTGKRLKAVELVAQDVLSDDEIAKHLTINKTTLERWKRRPEFIEKVQSAAAALAEEIRKEGIANKQNRIDSYVSDFELMEQVISARAIAYANGPGGSSGLVVGQLKQVKHVDRTDPESGERIWTEEVWEYAVDTGLLNERLKLRRQVAQELGQWVDKSEIGGSLRREYVIIREGDGG